MDELKEKWNKLSLFKSKPKTWKGQGNRLGSGTTQSAVDAQRQVWPASSAALRGQGPGASAAASKIPPGQTTGTRPREEPAPQHEAGSAGATAAQPSAPQSPQPAQASSSNSSQPRSTVELRQSSGSGTSALEEPVPQASEEVDHAVALLSADDHGDAAKAVLSKVLHNIISKPADAKFRRLRLGNKKIQDDVVNVDGGIEFLQAAGFQLVFEEDPATHQQEGYAVFPEDEDAEQLQPAMTALGTSGFRFSSAAAPAAQPSATERPVDGQRSSTAPAAPAASGAAQPRNAPAARVPAEPRDRQTQVLLPEDPKVEMSEEIFKRTPADVRAAYLAARRKQELGQMLMTRDYRAKLAGGGAKTTAASHGVIRVRLPEGIMLQGEFNAGEPVSRVFEWVTDALRDPGRTYELITPLRQPLVTANGTVAQADLLPSSLLNFRWLDQHIIGAATSLPSLRDELLAQTRPSVS